MKSPDSNEVPRLPMNLLRRRKQFRLRRRFYGESPVAKGGDDDRLQGQIDSLLQEKHDWTAKAAQLQDMLLRARTDLDNFRRRVQREREETRMTLTSDLLLTFLPVLDHFDLAVKAAQTSSDAKAILDGVVMIQRELVGVLQSLGLERIEEAGASFDPTVHEAVATDTVPDQPDHQVLEVMRPGWRYGERCLRAAMVKVNRVEESAPVNPPQP